MRTEGAGKGDALRYGINWKQFGENYDSIFRKPKRRKKEHPGTKAFRELIESGSPPSVLALFELERKYGKFPFPCGMGNTIQQ
jgi:hypothetical protein